MRLLILHVDRFAYTVTDAARSRLREEIAAPTHAVEEALLALASVEREDAAAPDEVAERAAAEIAGLARQLGVARIVLHPFAHLFGEPAPPAVAVAVLDATKARLAETGLDVHRSPFGWFTRWDLQAKGHPLSRVGRIVRPTTAPAGEETRETS
ncbi:MAG TPA: threonyl-tRNA synthetase editing domain-containing protein [Chloroflexota bacterium]|nr:threonyl-tRNA synthetase editing domain-containing protein [Chloroflexota bacterium]